MVHGRAVEILVLGGNDQARREITRGVNSVCTRRGGARESALPSGVAGTQNLTNVYQTDTTAPGCLRGRPCPASRFGARTHMPVRCRWA